MTAKQPEHEGGTPSSESASDTSHRRSEVLYSAGIKIEGEMDSTDVQMTHAVAVMETSCYCGLPRLGAKKAPTQRQGD